MSIRTLIVDDHQILLEGISALLARQPLIEVIGRASDGHEAVEMVAALLPDVVVMDLQLPKLNGIEAIRRIAKLHPEVRIVCLTAFSDPRQVADAMDAGALGFVLKDEAVSDLILAIFAAMENREYVTPKIAKYVTDVAKTRNRDGGRSVYQTLSNREREILQLLAEGKATKEIALALDVTTKTVETHRRSLKEKLQIDNVAELTKYAVREGITSL